MAGLTSYAQNFEDVILWRALGHVRNGRYIDIGAQSPVVDSVSMGFYERGWRGIHVEPTVTYSSQLRAARPDELVIEAAVDAAVGELVFFEVPDTGLSTTRRDIAEQHASAGFEFVERVVATTTLDEVLAAAQDQPIHWLKIDVEGSEGEVLQGWRKAKDRPWVLVVESTLPMTQTESHLEWESLVLEKGYRFAYFDGLNRFYVAPGHDDLLPAFAIGPNVFDGFVLSGTASSPFCGHVNTRLRALDNQIAVEREEAALRLEAAHNDAAERLHAVSVQLETYADRLQITQADLHKLRDLHLAQIGTFQAHVQWLEGQLTQIGTFQAHVQWLEGQLTQIGTFQAHVQWLEGQWDHSKVELGEVSAALHHWRAQSDRLSTELQAVFASTSWRLTAPVRLCKRTLSAALALPRRAIRRGIRLAKQVARPVLAKLMRGVLANARISDVVLRWLGAHPAVKARLRQFTTGSGVIDAAPDAFSWKFAAPAVAVTADPNLSPNTASVLSDLALAIAKGRR